jgi:hypothetical protein
MKYDSGAPTAPFSDMCSTQADNSSRKLRLRCGCQFPWCAAALRVHVLKSVAGKRIGKTLQGNSHCLDPLPSDDYCKQI